MRLRKIPVIAIAIGALSVATIVVNAAPGDPEPKAGGPSTPDHDDSVPPIDCPLRAQGVATHEMRPFAEVEEYIAFLDRSDRALWQRPDDVIRALDLSGDESVTDVGAGSGYFSFRLAAALPRGDVRAIDIEPEMIRHIHHRVLAEGIPNLEVALTTPLDPGVDEGADLVFVCDVLHHVENRRDWLKRLYAEMRPGARLVLIEFKEGDLPQGPPENLKLPRSELLALVREAGFQLSAEIDDLLPYQYFLFFLKT